MLAQMGGVGGTHLHPHHQFCHFHFYRLLCFSAPGPGDTISGSLSSSLQVLARGTQEEESKTPRKVLLPRLHWEPCRIKGGKQWGPLGCPRPAPRTRVHPGHNKPILIVPCPACFLPTVTESIYGDLNTTSAPDALSSAHKVIRQGLWEFPTISGTIRSAVTKPVTLRSSLGSSLLGAGLPACPEA